MARGSNQAQTGANQGLGYASQANNNAEGLYGTLAPGLTAETVAPPGMAPSDLAKINTAGQQSAGGSEAAAVGQGALRNARTRNAGGADAAVAESARDASQNLSKGALGTQIANARMKEGQRQEGFRGLEGLYGTNMGAETGNLNATSGLVNANTNAENASWDWAKYILDPAMAGAAEAGSAYLRPTPNG